MFEGEVPLACDKRKYGQKAAMEITGDIHEYTTLHGPREDAGVAYLEGRLIFDFNEHFIELGTPEQGRSLSFMLLGVEALVMCMALAGLYFAIFFWKPGHDMSHGALISGMLLLNALGIFVVGVLWYVHLRGFFFTALTARYRFNRTTGKVYVLRPRQFGGNAILDWHRVKAHVNWTAPLDLKPGYQHDVRQRDARQNAGGGHMMRRGLVLYWPPLDPEDPERQGEDIIWVGQWLCGQPLWSYIRTFMEEGMDAVPAPQPDEYRRKGRSSMWQHLWEGQLDSYVRGAKLQGHPNPRSAIGVGLYFREVPFLIFNSMAQWLCWWPTFPEEWNSDCGQKRRERGIGPEEPLRWEARDPHDTEKDVPRSSWQSIDDGDTRIGEAVEKRVSPGVLLAHRPEDASQETHVRSASGPLNPSAALPALPIVGSQDAAEPIRNTVDTASLVELTTTFIDIFQD